MAAKPSALRVLAITAVLACEVLGTAIWRYHLAVHRKLLTFLVFLAALPLGAALHRVDRLVFRSKGLGGLSGNARAGLVALAGIALWAVVMAIGNLLASLALLNEAAI